MRFALFSDIHSNLEALEKAVEYTQNQKIDFYAVLGDTVGYGANPNECLEWVFQHAEIVITGNHEKAVNDATVREWFNGWALEAIQWTAKVLTPALKRKIDGIPYLKIEHEMTFAHGSPDQPEEFRYLLGFQDTISSFASFQNQICFVGHTHIPACFCEVKRTAAYLRPGVMQLEKNERYILNPGSVGQPRDRDPRLAFGILDTTKQTFEIVRLEYDNRKAAAKIRKAGLPAYLADRLL